MKQKKFDILNICKVVSYFLAFLNFTIAICRIFANDKLTPITNNLFSFFMYLVVSQIIDCIVYIAENKTNIVNSHQLRNEPIKSDRCFSVTVNFSIKDVGDVKEWAKMKGYTDLEEYAYNLIKNDVQSYKRINCMDDFPPRL